jgi:hypothetical protein
MAGPGKGGPGVVWIPWYATVLRQETFAEKVAEVAPLALRYGATKYAVHRSLDDRYKITQMIWFDRREDWYRFWDGPEMIEFRRRNGGHFQIPVVYAWHEELATGELGPQVAPEALGEPEPQPTAAG